jgi:hypothetical protein
MKQSRTVAWVLALAGLAGLAGAGVVGSSEDDLAIVKKAVASPAPSRARESRPASASTKAQPPSGLADEVRVPAPEGRAGAAAHAVPEARPLPRAGREPQWFKVRVVEHGTGRAKVTINLPLSLVRALGDDAIDWGCRGEGDLRQCHRVRLSEVLRSLEAGQELVEVVDEEATVKVWVE